MTVRLIGLSKLPLGVSVCVHGCVSCVSLCCPVTDWRPVQGDLSPGTLVKKSWREARSHCWNLSSDLVTIHSAEENKAIRNISTTERLWIGLFKDPWTWSGGSNSSFRFWVANEPKYGSNGNCVTADLRNNGKWSTQNCNNRQSVICGTGMFFLFFLYYLSKKTDWHYTSCSGVKICILTSWPGCQERLLEIKVKGLALWSAYRENRAYRFTISTQKVTPSYDNKEKNIFKYFALFFYQ
uniref:C-type lectin domain-containing protein n=1 Tax=Poecilia reticulata TaxID=8081 RepID=A0A3P9N1Y3_POERE